MAKAVSEEAKEKRLQSTEDSPVIFERNNLSVVSVAMKITFTLLNDNNKQKEIGLFLNNGKSFDS